MDQKPPDLDETGNLLPIKPPDLDENHKPITVDSPEERLKFVTSLWNRGNTPLVKFSTDEATEQFSQEHPYLSIFPNFAKGIVEAQSAPLTLGTEALTLGASIPGIKDALGYFGKMLGGVTGAHGAYNVEEGIRTGDYPRAISGGLETGIGALPFFHGRKSGIPELTEKPNLGPEFTPVGEEPVAQPGEKAKSPEQLAYESASRKFGMGREGPISTDVESPISTDIPSGEQPPSTIQKYLQMLKDRQPYTDLQKQINKVERAQKFGEARKIQV